MVRLYGRVLGFLKAERRLAIGLAATNVVLAVAAFAEPLLMGRIIDQLTHLKRGGNAMTTMLPLLAAWVAFGFFTIAAGVFIALHADRLALLIRVRPVGGPPHRRARRLPPAIGQRSSGHHAVPDGVDEGRHHRRRRRGIGGDRQVRAVGRPRRTGE